MDALTKFSDIACCPDLDTSPVCDVFDMRRRLTFPARVGGQDGQVLTIPVEVTFHTRFTRCSGPLALGDLAYTTTLLPGEKVRLATTDRRSRFSFDSETGLTYRSEQMSEEQYRMSALRAFMADENSTDNGSDRSSDKGSWDFHGDGHGSIGFMSASADANAHGSHNSESASEYLREHSAHAKMSDNLSVEATRKAHSVSVGEVSTREHKEGESQDHYESSSREFTNPNQCHAITFLFYRLNKTETITFELVSIDRRVIDPVAPTPVLANPIRLAGGLAPVPQEVPATAKARLDIERRGLESEALHGRGSSAGSILGVRFATGAQPVSPAIRQAALAEVDKELIAKGLLDKSSGQVSKKAQEEAGFERRTSIPTAGVIVKGCLDDCDICEPEVERRTKLELEHLDLQNQLLKRQIELLEKSQEYRCCPEGSIETGP